MWKLKKLEIFASTDTYSMRQAHEIQMSIARTLPKATTYKVGQQENSAVEEEMMSYRGIIVKASDQITHT